MTKRTDEQASIDPADTLEDAVTVHGPHGAVLAAGMLLVTEAYRLAPDGLTKAQQKAVDALWDQRQAVMLLEVEATPELAAKYVAGVRAVLGSI